MLLQVSQTAALPAYQRVRPTAAAYYPQWPCCAAAHAQPSPAGPMFYRLHVLPLGAFWVHYAHETMPAMAARFADKKGMRKTMKK